jgi:hypothetical protein
VVANCELHPLIHIRLKFNLAQDMEVCQRFSGLGKELPQTGHTFSVGFIIRLPLHIEHLTERSLARSISAGSRLIIGGVGYAVSFFFAKLLRNFLNRRNGLISVNR